MGTASAGEPERMQFRRMDEGSDADFVLLAEVHERAAGALPDLLSDMVSQLGADDLYPINRLDHSLQTATRALRDGRDEEYVLCALFHDVGESLGPFNHGEVAAAIPRPSFRPRTTGCWRTIGCSRSISSVSISASIPTSGTGSCPAPSTTAP